MVNSQWIMLNVEFASGIAEASTPIHSITERLSLSPSSSTRTAIDLPYGLSSHRERYGLTVFRLFARVGKVLSIRRWSFVHDREVLSPCTDHVPFGPSLSASLACCE